MFVNHLNGHHETFKGQFIKCTIYGEMPIGIKSHQDSLFWSIGSLLSEGYYGRPCINSVESLVWDFSINNESNPINLGAK